MDNDSLEALKYPIGKYKAPNSISEIQLKEWIAILEFLPTKLEKLVGTLSKEQLETAYRPGGWTVRQLIHHIADSHHNSYIRFKWGLTENNPVIKPYLQTEWSNLFDSNLNLAYRGQLDDSRPGNNIPLSGADLREALDNLLNKKPISKNQKPSIGCNIKWK